MDPPGQLSTAWIRPNRPLIGDQGQVISYDDTITDHLEYDDSTEKDPMDPTSFGNIRTATADTIPLVNADDPRVPDWLHTRRRKVQATELLSPADAKVMKELRGEIPVIEGKLLTKKEITSCLKALGGTNIVVILDDPFERRMIGSLGIIIATASTQTQLQLLSDTLLKQLRRRKLDQYGVFGAQQGAEVGEGWILLDCRNYIVHLMDARTRANVRLEDLWTGIDPLHKIDPDNEVEVEDYVANHPVPSDFAYSNMGIDVALKEIQKARWVAPHRPVIPVKSRARRKQKKRK